MASDNHRLPVEVLIEIFDYCDLKTLQAARNVSKEWRVLIGERPYYIRHSTFFRVCTRNFFSPMMPNDDPEHVDDYHFTDASTANIAVRMKKDTQMVKLCAQLCKSRNTLPLSLGIAIDHLNVFEGVHHPQVKHGRLDEDPQNWQVWPIEGRSIRQRVQNVLRIEMREAPLQNLMIHGSMSDRIDFQGRNVTDRSFGLPHCAPICGNNLHIVRNIQRIYATSLDDRIIETIKGQTKLRTLFASFNRGYKIQIGGVGPEEHILRLMPTDPFALCRLNTLFLTAAIRRCNDFYNENMGNTLVLEAEQGVEPNVTDAFFDVISEAQNIDIERYAPFSFRTFVYILDRTKEHLRYFTFNCHPTMLLHFQDDDTVLNIRLPYLRYLSFSHKNYFGFNVELDCLALEKLQVGYCRNVRYITNASRLEEVCFNDRFEACDLVMEFLQRSPIKVLRIYLRRMDSIYNTVRKLFKVGSLPFLEHLVVRSEMNIAHHNSERVGFLEQCIDDFLLNRFAYELTNFYFEVLKDGNYTPRRKIPKLTWIMVNVPTTFQVSNAFMDLIRTAFSFFTNEFIFKRCEEDSIGQFGCDKCNQLAFGSFAKISLPQARSRLLRGGIWWDGEL